MSVSPTGGAGGPQWPGGSSQDADAQKFFASVEALYSSMNWLFLSGSSYNTVQLNLLCPSILNFIQTWQQYGNAQTDPDAYKIYQDLTAPQANGKSFADMAKDYVTNQGQGMMEFQEYINAYDPTNPLWNIYSTDATNWMNDNASGVKFTTAITQSIYSDIDAFLQDIKTFMHNPNGAHVLTNLISDIQKLETDLQSLSGSDDPMVMLLTGLINTPIFNGESLYQLSQDSDASSISSAFERALAENGQYIASALQGAESFYNAWKG